MNIAQLQDKNIMKKLEDDVKPVIYETKKPDEVEVRNVKQFYSTQLMQQPMLSQHICQLANEHNIHRQGEHVRMYMIRKPGQSQPDPVDLQTSSFYGNDMQDQQSSFVPTGSGMPRQGSYHMPQSSGYQVEQMPPYMRQSSYQGYQAAPQQMDNFYSQSPPPQNQMMMPQQYLPKQKHHQGHYHGGRQGGHQQNWQYDNRH